MKLLWTDKRLVQRFLNSNNRDAVEGLRRWQTTNLTNTKFVSSDAYMIPQQDTAYIYKYNTKYHSTTDHEFSGITERIAMKIGTKALDAH